MPIKFRCSHCRQFLGISRSKANSVTDCPTCGRTIRVPGLDGKVAPVPSPKLNLEDSELRQALGALAELEEFSEYTQSEEEQVEPQQPSVHTAKRENEIPVVVVEQVQQTPAVVVIDEEARETSSESVASLSELANSEYAIPIVEPVLSSSSRLLRLGLFALAGVVLFGTGFLIGKQSTFSTSNQPAEVRAENAIVDDREGFGGQKEEPEVHVEPQTRISGSITYRTNSGESRADKGARLLVLPLPRKGTSKLSADGFRVGANTLDQEVLKAAATALGGAFLLADTNGKFELSHLPPGRYGLLIASRYQPKDDLQKLGKNESDLLTSYFESPTQVIGMLQSHYQDVSLTAENELVIEHEFMQ